MIDPKQITVDSLDGDKKDFIIHKLPAVLGREIVVNYPLTAMPKVGEYKANEDIMKKLMAHVCVVTESGTKLPLKTQELIDSHCSDWQMLAKLEMAMLEYNTNFFGNGKVSKLLNGFAEKLPALITKILTDSLQQSSANKKQH